MGVWAYPISLPTAPFPVHSKMRMNNVVAVGESPLTLTTQIQKHQGERWECDVQMPPMRRRTAEKWIATFSKLEGRRGTFLMPDYDAVVAMGSTPGAPAVNGLNAIRSTQLNTKGWTANQSGILLAGDYIQLGSAATTRLYKVQDDVNSDAAGLATLQIWPRLRNDSLDNDLIVTANCMTQFKLTTIFEWDADEVSTYGFSFSAVEWLL